MELEIEVVGKGKATAKLDGRNPETATRFYKNLPLEGNAKCWLDEVYFIIPLELEYENQSPNADKGDLSYWPPGAAFCIFYGQSQPASPVNHIGKLTSNLELFKLVEPEDIIIVRKV
ncbi:MAG TPA: cyclophilin-like fold protein [Methanobacterium sp.]